MPDSPPEGRRPPRRRDYQPGILRSLVLMVVFYGTLFVVALPVNLLQRTTGASEDGLAWFAQLLVAWGRRALSGLAHGGRAPRGAAGPASLPGAG